MLEKLKTVLSEQVDIRNKDIDLETNLLTDLGLSSMDKVNLIVAVENAFDIEIPEDKLRNIITVGDVVSIIREEINKEA
ncbi:MAG: acyl carrier protein [Lachnospiraceae bacterium]